MLKRNHERGFHTLNVINQALDYIQKLSEFGISRVLDEINRALKEKEKKDEVEGMIEDLDGEITEVLQKLRSLPDRLQGKEDPKNRSICDELLGRLKALNLIRRAEEVQQAGATESRERVGCEGAAVDRHIGDAKSGYGTAEKRPKVSSVSNARQGARNGRGQGVQTMIPHFARSRRSSGKETRARIIKKKAQN